MLRFITVSTLLHEPSRQCIVLSSNAFAGIHEPLQGVSTTARFEHFPLAHADARHGAEQLGEKRHVHEQNGHRRKVLHGQSQHEFRCILYDGGLQHIGIRRELAGLKGVDGGIKIFEKIDEPGFGPCSIRIQQSKQHFQTGGISRQVAGTAVGDGVAQPLTPATSGIIGGHLQSLDLHRKLPTPVFFA